MLEHLWESFFSLCSFLYISCPVYTFLFPYTQCRKKLLLSMMQMSYMIFVCCCFCLHATDNQTKLNHRQITTTKQWLRYNIHGKDQKQRLRSWWWYQYYIVCLVLKTIVFHFVQIWLNIFEMSIEYIQNKSS